MRRGACGLLGLAAAMLGTSVPPAMGAPPQVEALIAVRLTSCTSFAFIPLKMICAGATPLALSSCHWKTTRPETSGRADWGPCRSLTPIWSPTSVELLPKPGWPSAGSMPNLML